MNDDPRLRLRTKLEQHETPRVEPDPPRFVLDWALPWSLVLKRVTLSDRQSTPPEALGLCIGYDSGDSARAVY